MPLMGKEELIVISWAEIFVTEVFTVEGKNPAKSGRAVNAINAILRIAVLLCFVFYYIDYTVKTLKVH